MQSESRRRAQFELERQLRQNILDSPRQGRTAVITDAYETLFTSFPDHRAMSLSEDECRKKGRMKAALIAPFLKRPSRILEVGAGRGYTLEALSALGHTCTGVEPSDVMIKKSHVEIRNGTADRLDFPDASFDLVFSQELIEHLHPEDVVAFFAEGFRVLKPGGIFSVETPNRTTGPQDISRGFTATAQGLHLKEYSVSELAAQFRTAGFRCVRGLLSAQALARRCALLHRLTHVPVWIKGLEDLLLHLVPRMDLRTKAGKLIGLDDLFLFARKPQ